ncbi:MAG: hypothetical protein ACLFO2_02155 [Candidatus Woesearchaeota archaeon]
MRLHLLLLALLLLTPIAFAAEEEVHDDWHAYHDFFNLDDDYYEAINDHRLGSDSVRVSTMIKQNQDSFIINGYADLEDDESVYKLREPLCKATDDYRFCVVNISYDPDKAARSDEKGQYRHGTRISIYKRNPDHAKLEVEQALSEDTLHLHEESKVTIEVTNTGLVKAEDIRLNQTIGEGLAFKDHDDFQRRVGRRLEAAIPVLYPDESESYQFKVTAEDYINQTTTTTSASYHDPDPATARATKKLDITWPFKAECKLSPDETKIGQPVTITCKITNHERVPAEATLRINPVADLEAGSLENLDEQGQLLVRQQEVQPGETISSRAELSTRYTGDYDVKAHARMEVNGYNFTHDDEKSFSVKTDTITPKISLSKDKMRSGEPITMGLYLYNEDKQLPFVNVDGWFGAGFFNDTYNITTIDAGGSDNPVFKTYRPPEVKNQTTHTVQAAGTFTTQAGEEKEFYTQKELIVIPENQSIILLHEADKDEVERGGNVTVTVTVENIADSGSSHVTVYEDYPKSLEKIFGNTEAETYLYGGEAKEMYVYQVRVPEYYPEDTLTLNGTMLKKGVKVTTQVTEVDVTGNITQAPPKDDEPAQEGSDGESGTTDDPAQQGNETTTGQDEAEGDNRDPYDEPEKDGVLKKVVNAIADFFEGLFS